MSEWKVVISERLARLRLEPTREAEIVEELSQHLEDRYEELLSGGATEKEASRAVLVELSESEMLRQELGRVERQFASEPVVLGTNRKGNMMTDLWQDLRYGLRMLRQQPGFTAVAVVTLDLGVVIHPAVFSVVGGGLLGPLPYQNPGRLGRISRAYHAPG